MSIDLKNLISGPQHAVSQTTLAVYKCSDKAGSFPLLLMGFRELRSLWSSFSHHFPFSSIEENLVFSLLQFVCVCLYM